MTDQPIWTRTRTYSKDRRFSIEFKEITDAGRIKMDCYLNEEETPFLQATSARYENPLCAIANIAVGLYETGILPNFETVGVVIKTDFSDKPRKINLATPAVKDTVKVSY